MLTIDNPTYDPKSQMMIVVGYIDIVFTCLFTIEAMIKIIAKGFMFNNLGPVEPYIRNAWNSLDTRTQPMLWRAYLYASSI